MGEKELIKSMNNNNSARINRVNQYSELTVMVFILAIGLIVTITATLLYPYVPILMSISLYGKDAFWEGLLVNLHNSMFDFFLLVVLLYYFTHKIEEKKKIQSYYDNIDDIRFFFSQEATSKLIANINRLNRCGHYKIDLSKCHLEGGFLKGVHLIESLFMGSNLKHVNLRNAILNGSDFKGASMEYAQLPGVSAIGVKMRYIKCEKTNFQGANLGSSDFRNADLVNSDFKSTILKNSDFAGAKFDDSSLERANLLGAKNIDVSSLIKCKTLKYAKIDPDLIEIIKQINPALLE